MGQSTISMAMFNSYVKLPEGTMNKIVMKSKKYQRKTYKFPSISECYFQTQKMCISHSNGERKNT